MNRDAWEYLIKAFFPSSPFIRSIFYSHFIRAVTLGGNLGVMAVIWVQSLISCLMLYLLFKRNSSRKYTNLFYLLCVGILGLVTQWAWFISHIGPHLFGTWLAIGIYLLVFVSNKLSKLEVAFVSFCVILATICHQSFTPIFFAVMIMLSMMDRSFKSIPHFSMKLRRTWMLWVFALFIISSAKLFSQEKSTDNVSFFLFSRMVKTGKVSQILKEQCDLIPYKLCPYQNELLHLQNNNFQSGAFLWDHSSPFESIGGWKESKSELVEIIKQSFIQHPFANLKEALTLTYQQLFTFKIAFSRCNFDEAEIHQSQLKKLARLSDRVPIIYRSLVKIEDLENCVPQTMLKTEKFRVELSYWLFLILLATAVIGTLKSKPNAFTCYSVIFLCANALVSSFFGGLIDRSSGRMMILPAINLIFLIGNWVHQRYRRT